MLVSHHRTTSTDAILGMLLAFVAGAMNAGGFIAIGRYTSHVTGLVSAIADDLVLGFAGAVVLGFSMLVFFIAGAGCSAILINWGRRNAPSLQYAYPLGLEAVLLLFFGATGWLAPSLMIPVVAPLLSFIMGLQNATITKISGARVRTTHVTGMVTDIGIELGKMIYWNRVPARQQSHRVHANRSKLALLLKMVGTFFSGGVAGAFGYGFFGSAFSIPLATLLLLPVLGLFKPARAKPGTFG